MSALHLGNLLRLTRERIAAGQPLPQSGFGLARAVGGIVRPLVGSIATAAGFPPGISQMFGAGSAAGAGLQNDPFGGAMSANGKLSLPGLPIPFPRNGAPVIQAGLGSIFGSIAGSIAGRLGRPTVGATLPAVGTAIARTGGALVAAGRRFLNTPGGKWTRRAIRDFGLVIVGGLVFDAAGNLMGSVARRRMNPLNHRALRRAIRRVKSARGICQDVERMLPRKKAAAPCAPKRRR